MTSIREVAKLAGVSPATVSRVMNGTANVNEEKKKRVEAAIKETGFQPNELARALYKKSSKMIGMIVPDIENPFFSELAKAVEDTAYQNGYRILLCSSGGDEEKEAVNIQMFNQLRADGIVVMTNCAETGKVLEDCPIPVVLVDRKLDGFKENALIEADNYKGGCLAEETIAKLRRMGIPITVSETTNYKTDKKPVRMDYQDDVRIPEFKELPTFKRICICILKNDHACKYMGFAPSKAERERRAKVMQKYKSIMESYGRI